MLAYLTTYTLVAKPGPGHTFGGWLGDQATLSPTIYLYKHTNVSQTATFMPNPFIPLAGTYRGLYGRTNPLSIKSSGALAFTLGTPGTYSGTINTTSARRKSAAPSTPGATPASPACLAGKACC